MGSGRSRSYAEATAAQAERPQAKSYNGRSEIARYLNCLRACPANLYLTLSKTANLFVNKKRIQLIK